MFGKILFTQDFKVVVENASKKVETSLLGVHVVFEGVYKIVGEVTRITENEIECLLQGEFINGKFVSGILHMPNGSSKIRIIKKEEVFSLVGSQDFDSKDSIYIGKSTIYDGFNVSADMNKFFSNHFAIIGNTGSGKSSTVSRIIQNLFYRTQNLPLNSRMVLFDVYGEYHTAFEKINNGVCRYKSYTTDINSVNNGVVKIPAYFLEIDDIALLLGVDNPSQLPILEKTLKYVYLFTEDESKVIAYKNNIIAKSVLDIITSGKSPAQIRDHITAVLSTFNTKDLNLDSKIIQPGYIRTLRQCLNIDQTGKINTIQLATEFIESFVNEDLKLNSSMIPKKYTLKDLYFALEFALISEGILKSDRVYDASNVLKVRLDSIINGPYAHYFDMQEFISKDEYIRRLFTSDDGKPAQLVSFNLDFVDERFAKVLTKIFSKMLFTYAIEVSKVSKYSVQIVLEEAHRYVQNDNDINVIGYNIFDRITKEGRKYGVTLGLITQRPCELSTTSLSQCSNYIILRMFHPSDLDLIKNITHSVSDKSIDRLKSLTPGVALCFGNAFNIPIIVKIDEPNPYPKSANANIKEIWFQ